MIERGGRTQWFSELAIHFRDKEELTQGTRMSLEGEERQDLKVSLEYIIRMSTL